MSKKLVVGLVYGGRSGEHEVSLLSAASILQHIDMKSYEVLAIGISHEGQWYLQPKRIVDACLAGGPLELDQRQPLQLSPGIQPVLSVAGPKPRDLAVDVFFPVLHGSYGEDGSIQGLFEMLRVPYVGNTVLGSSLGMDKVKTKQVWEQAGLPVVPYITFHYSSPSDLPHSARAEDLWRVWTQKLGSPLFVKPARAGSSVGISRVEEPAQLEAALREALQYDSKLLIEKALQPREIEVAVLGNLNPRIFPAGEIRSSHTFYDYEAKYQDPDGAQLLVPAPISEEMALRIADHAIRAFRSAELRGLARVDFFLAEDSEELYLNEINTMPGFTKISMYPRMCEAGGLPFSKLIEELIALGQEEFQRREGLRYHYQD